MLSRCGLDLSVGVGDFVIRLSQSLPFSPFDYTAFMVSENFRIPYTGLTTPIG